MAGFTGTLITGIVASAAIALVVRAKPMAGVALPAASDSSRI
jgi:hypothetical protein